MQSEDDVLQDVFDPHIERRSNSVVRMRITNARAPRGYGVKKRPTSSAPSSRRKKKKRERETMAVVCAYGQLADEALPQNKEYKWWEIPPYEINDGAGGRITVYPPRRVPQRDVEEEKRNQRQYENALRSAVSCCDSAISEIDEEWGWVGAAENYLEIAEKIRRAHNTSCTRMSRDFLLRYMQVLCEPMEKANTDLAYEPDDEETAVKKSILDDVSGLLDEVKELSRPPVIRTPIDSSSSCSESE